MEKVTTTRQYMGNLLKTPTKVSELAALYFINWQHPWAYWRNLNFNIISRKCSLLVLFTLHISSTEWFTWTLESRIYEISRISEVSVQLYYLQGTCWRGLEDCLQKNIWKSCVLHFVMSKLITGVIIDVVSRGQTNGLGLIKQENK